MTFLPIVERELRVAARRRGTYWLRLLVAVALVLAATWIFLASKNQPQQEVGQMMFYVLTGGLMLYCLLGASRSTADCLSEEKRDGTLGLLFLTDLRGYDVVIGKLTANSLGVFYCVIAVLPVLAIPLLMGGVSGGEFGRVALVLVNTLFFSLSAGMLASALCKNGRAALATALLLILLGTAGSPVLGLGLWWLEDGRTRYEDLFLIPSPIFAYVTALDSNFARSVGKWFYWSLGIIHGLSWVFLALASRIAPRSWQDKVSNARGQRRRELVQSGLEGDAENRRAFRARLLDMNAFFWLAARPRSRAIWGWVPLTLAVLVWAWGIYKLGREWLHPVMYVVTAFILSVSMKVLIGAEAGRRLIEDRRIGAMELLLSTPLSVREILHGQLLALRRMFLAPVLVILAADVWMLVAGLNHVEFGPSSGDRMIWFWTWMAGMAMFAADVAALYWLGMWTGLAVRNPKHAFGAAIVPVLALPWIGMGVVMTIIEFLPYELRRSFRWDGFPLLLWFGFGVGVDLIFGLAARANLLRNFRVIAAQRYQPKPSLWQRWFGKSAE